MPLSSNSNLKTLPTESCGTGPSGEAQPVIHVETCQQIIDMEWTPYADTVHMTWHGRDSPKTFPNSLSFQNIDPFFLAQEIQDLG